MATLTINEKFVFDGFTKNRNRSYTFTQKLPLKKSLAGCMKGTLTTRTDATSGVFTNAGGNVSGISVNDIIGIGWYGDGTAGTKFNPKMGFRSGTGTGKQTQTNFKWSPHLKVSAVSGATITFGIVGITLPTAEQFASFYSDLPAQGKEIFLVKGDLESLSLPSYDPSNLAFVFSTDGDKPAVCVLNDGTVTKQLSLVSFGKTGSDVMIGQYLQEFDEYCDVLVENSTAQLENVTGIRLFNFDEDEVNVDFVSLYNTL